MNQSQIYQEYSTKLSNLLSSFDWSVLDPLSEALYSAWKERRKVFICGNGGSAANAIHIANDLLYGVSPNGKGLNVEALTANPSIMTCLANDLDYDQIFSRQLKVLAKPNDLLVVLSGSGNSANIISALETAKHIGVKTFAILGFSGGKSKEIADHSIHFEIDDMQISEDCQVVVGHMLMKVLNIK